MIFLLLFLHSAGESLGPPRCCQWHLFIMFSGCVVFHARHVPHLPYLFLSMDSLPPHPGPCRQCCSEHCGACILFDRVFSGCVLPSGVGQSYGGCLQFLKDPTLLRSSCISRHSCWQCGRLCSLRLPAFAVCGFGAPGRGLGCPAGFSLVAASRAAPPLRGRWLLSRWRTAFSGCGSGHWAQAQ